MNEYSKMVDSMYNFGGKYSQVYARKCDCGRVIEVSTQEDDEPEYYTDVFVKCVCGRSVWFELPVN